MVKTPGNRPLASIGRWCALALIVLMGCEKQSFIETVTQTPYLGLPTEIVQINSINIMRLRSREGFDKVERQLEMMSKTQLLMDLIRNEIGFSPLHDIDLLIIGVARGKVDPDNPLSRTIMIAQGRFEPIEEKLEKLTRWLGREYLINPPPFKKTTHPGSEFAKYRSQAQSQYNERIIFDMNFAMLTETMILFSFSPELIDSTLNVMSSQKEGLGSDQFWLDMIARPDIGAPIWGTGSVDEKFVNFSANLSQDSMIKMVRQYYYSLDMGADFKALIGLVCASIDDAKALTAAVKEGLKKITQLINSEDFKKIVQIPPETAKLVDKIVVMTNRETTEILIQLVKSDCREIERELKTLLKQAAEGGAAEVPLIPPSLPTEPGEMDGQEAGSTGSSSGNTSNSLPSR